MTLLTKTSQFLFFCTFFVPFIFCGKHFLILKQLIEFNFLICFCRPVPESTYETSGSGLFVSHGSRRLECSEELQNAFCSEKGIFCQLWNSACEAYNSSKNPSKLGPAIPVVAAKANIFGGGGAAFGGGVGFGGGGGGFVAGGGGFPAVGGGVLGQKKENSSTDLWPYYKLWFEYHQMKKVKEAMKVKNSLVLRDRIEICRSEFVHDLLPRDFALFAMRWRSFISCVP
jgi:hypothetical protein